MGVVIPTYNRREFAAEAVASVLGQTLEDLELVVVDDGSTDSTAEALARQFGDPRLQIVRQQNLGVSAARNHGARLVTAPWLCFLDSDDYWKPEKLERQLAATEAAGVLASYTEEVWYRRGKWANPKNEHSKYSGSIFSRCLPLCIISPSSIMLDRQLYSRLGGFDESLPACEDYDLWLRLSAREPVLLVEDKLIVKRNGHEGQLSQAFVGLDRFRVRALWKTALDEALEADKRALALKWIMKKSKVVSNGAAKRGNAERARIFAYSRDEAARLMEQLCG